MEDPRIAMKDALKEAMKNKDALRRDTLRMTMNAFKQVEVDDQRELSAEEAMDILMKEVKKRRDTIDELVNAGREDSAEQERAELAVIESFLPQQLSEDEIAALAREAIAETGASSPKEMGQVMGALMPKVKGRADGKLVNQVVRQLLQG